MVNAIKRIFIASNIKADFVKAAVMIISLIPTKSAKRSNTAVSTPTEFVLLALLPSLSHQEAVLLVDAPNIVPKAVLSAILALF